MPTFAAYAYDTLIFLAICYCLAVNAVVDTSLHSRLMSILTGKGLYSLSKSLMRSGQLYYL